jgi:hypothetical protein
MEIQTDFYESRYSNVKRQFRQIGIFQDNMEEFPLKDAQMQSLLSKPDSVIERNTVPLPPIDESSFLRSILPGFVQRIAAAMLIRMQAPEPEGVFTRGLRVVRPGANIPGWLPILTLTSASGMFVAAVAYDIARTGGTTLELEVIFLLGLLVIFVPVVVRLLSKVPSRFERICLLCLVGMCFYLVQVMTSPLYVSSFDEFLHWLTAIDIARTGHLFSPNPMLPVSPYYPGMEMVTNALSAMSGLSIFHAGLIVIGVARLVMILSLFLLYEQVTRSIRMASIATIIYMTNAHFLFFDAQFSYESLGIPLATFMLYMLVRYETMHKDHRWIITATWIALGAVVVTHHVTNYVFNGLLILWAVISLFQASSYSARRSLVTIALFGVLISLAYAFFLEGNPVWGYLSGYFRSTFNELGRIITGTSTARQLFINNTGQPTPIWDKLLMITSLALASFGIPFGLLSIWKQHRHNSLALMFGLTSFFYPISQVFLFTNLGAGITDRSVAFLFLPVSYVLTMLITQLWPTRKLNWKGSSLVTCAIAVLFLGGIILDAGPSWSNLPGHYFVVDDVRSIEPEGIQAALWASSSLGPNNRVMTDRINRLLMSTYGNQWPVTELEDKVNVAPVFFASSFGVKEVALLRSARIRYLVVDLRLSTSLPVVGFYFENLSEGGFDLTAPISRDALIKFNTVPQIKRVFDSGNIVIYDVGGLTNAP